MPTRTGLLLVLLVVAAVGAVVWMLMDEDLTGSGDELARREDGTYDPGDPLAVDPTKLVGRSDAKSEEQRAAERAAREAAAQAPAFPRSEGVFGRVTDAGGRGIADATVKLVIPERFYTQWGVPDPPAIATAKTDAEGSFLVGPAPEGILKIRAEAEGFAPTVKSLKRRGYRVDLILDRGGILDVLVKSVKGLGIEGAHVMHQGGNVVTDVRSDANGLAHFPGLPTGSGQLFVTAEGYAGVTVGDLGVSPGRTEQRTVVLGKPLVVDGKVLDGETEIPVTQAKIRIRYPSMPWIEDTTGIASDEDGRFEVEVPLPVGQSMDVEVSADEYAPRRSWYQASDSGSGRMTLEIKLTSGRRGAIRGQVVDARDRPLAGVRVLYVSERQGQEAPETTSKQDGSFSLPPVAWATRRGASVQIAGISDTAGVGTAWVKVPKEGEITKPVTIRMSGTGTIRGKVVDGAGEPVGGALVSIQIDWRASQQMAQRTPSRRWWQTWSLIQDPRYLRLDQITDDEGRYAMTGVPLGVYILSASFGLDVSSAEESVKVEAGATATADITLGEGATIEGTVQDVDGRPVAGAHVTAWAEGTRIRGRRQSLSARSQSDGRFVLHGASQDSYSLRARASGFQSKRVKGVRIGSKDTILGLQPLGWIEGVVSYEGRPYQGTFTVTAKPTQAPDPRRMGESFWPGGSHNSRQFNTDDGTFRLRDLQGGEYDVGAQTPEGLIALDAVRVSVTLGRGSRAALSLVGGGRVEGRLVTDATGEPIANASVNARPVTGPDAPVTTANARTDADGRFILRGLQTGRYGVNVWPPSGIRIRRLIEVRAGEVQTLDLREQSPGEVHVYVHDTAGSPVAGARPRLKTESGDEEWPNWSVLRRAGYDMSGSGWSKIIQTDENGRNVRPFVPVGRYRVEIQKAGYQTVDAPWIEVPSGRSVEVEVTVRAVEQAQPSDGR